MSLLDKVDLKSYSSSSGYCGYFAYNGRDFKFGAKAANKVVFDYLKSKDADSVEIYSSLRVGYDADLISLYGYSAEEVDNYLLPAIFCKPPMIDRQEGELDDFSVISFVSDNENALYGACYAMMALGGLRGHLFINFIKEGFCLYPHDDTGFGVISVGPLRASAYDFLASVDSAKFEVIRE
ncbi:hypothetical protein [Pseudomonas petrae]|uniref:Uncharacterized protein n=1 Tax=Pseudomonas petrae TaxID=2912190 RepID=A0ABS9I6V0_9PSED|nr:hypothetical protein [Pseudomonas petrae]MCF7532175.1 hypothetical protein [Pseudomonas petrae]MCF7537708.1 hypothetical protein [Pseudomonas petrae]MCF7543500.1 hypothetical protein [Pseudomonas petrae]